MIEWGSTAIIPNVWEATAAMLTYRSLRVRRHQGPLTRLAAPTDRGKKCLLQQK